MITKILKNKDMQQIPTNVRKRGRFCISFLDVCLCSDRPDKCLYNAMWKFRSFIFGTWELNLVMELNDIGCGLL